MDMVNRLKIKMEEERKAKSKKKLLITNIEEYYRIYILYVFIYFKDNIFLYHIY